MVNFDQENCLLMGTFPIISLSLDKDRHVMHVVVALSYQIHGKRWNVQKKLIWSYSWKIIIQK